MHRQVLLATVAVSVLTFAFCTLPAVAQEKEEPQYQTYERTPSPNPLFQIAFTQEEIIVSVLIDGTKSIETALQREVREVSDSVVLLPNRVWFDREGLHFQDQFYPYEAISETRITDNTTQVTIEFLTIEGDTERLGRLRRGNRMTFDEPITVPSQDFVRGLVFSVTGDIEVFGEVNKDIVSLFGNVYVGSGATARGDVASVSGDLTVADNGAVYGELYSSEEYFERRRPRFYRDENFDFTAAFEYNRVDGATPYLGIRFRDVDSLLPTAWFEAGYAFESERWRTELGIEQPLWRTMPLSVGAAYYRRIASEDDWLLGDGENTAFALLATEDYKDYWEAEGGTLWLDFKPYDHWRFETRYRYEATNWRRAYRHLWSLFGGSKLFRENFSTAPPDFREANIELIDTTENAHLSFVVDWDTHNESEPFSVSGWHATAELEWSDEDLSSDFDYRRYTISVRRYQKVHEHSMLLFRVVHGNSDGFLPMDKRFYLGGLGTLRGYGFKEYMGTRFWMANAEYRFEFPKSDIAASVFWDLGQLANETTLESGTDVKQSVGAALMMGKDFRVSLARRLDRGEDVDPKVNVRFDYVF